MASTTLTTYVKFATPIRRAGGEDFTELQIKVGYDKGSMNYFSGCVNERGIYVYFIPVLRCDGMMSQCLLGDTRESGFKVFVKPLNRKSQKQLDNAFGAIMPDFQYLTNLFESGLYASMANIVRTKIR